MESVLQRGFFQGYDEVLGSAELSATLGEKSFSLIQEKKQEDYQKPFDPLFFEFFDEALRKRYGILASEGIARSAGRLAFKAYKDQMQVFVARGSVENRLLPFTEKIGGTLQDFLLELNTRSFTDLTLRWNVQKNAWSLKGNLLLPRGMLLQVGGQQFLIGLLESMLEWLDSRHSFQIDQLVSLGDNSTGQVDLMVSVKKFD